MFNVTDHRQSDLHKFAHSSSVSLRKTKDTGEAVQPLRFVYYTECDQIVRFDSETTFDALSAASNESCFFVGRRRDKVYSSAPEDYMGSLDNYRNCGERGYSMIWPGDKYVRHGWCINSYILALLYTDGEYGLKHFVVMGPYIRMTYRYK